jgi:hypothetical protein
LTFERSPLAATPHNRLLGEDALFAKGGSPTSYGSVPSREDAFLELGGIKQPDELFSCALFPTLQQLGTVWPEDDEWEADRRQGGPVDGESTTNQAFGA